MTHVYCCAWDVFSSALEGKVSWALLQIRNHPEIFLASSFISSWDLHLLKSPKVWALVLTVVKDAWNSVYTEVRLQLLLLLSQRFLWSKCKSHIYSSAGTAEKIGVWGFFLIVLGFCKVLLGKDSKNCWILSFPGLQIITVGNKRYQWKKNKDRNINCFY